MYLVDTDVISLAARTPSDAIRSLAEWMDRNSDRLYLSVITIAEIEDGIAKVRRQGAQSKADALASWLDAVLHLYGDRVLPFDVAAARIAGKLADFARSRGRHPGFPDLAIAATAQSRELTVLTRNLRHFNSLGVAARDPVDDRSLD